MVWERRKHDAEIDGNNTKLSNETILLHCNSKILPTKQKSPLEKIEQTIYYTDSGGHPVTLTLDFSRFLQVELASSWLTIISQIYFASHFSWQF